jgi:pilus assembly protein CpaE
VGPPPIKVLIVDDMAETRENLRKLLSFHGGFAVIGEAENGKEAVTLAKRLRPDIVLMDINMPVMSGIEATRTISVEMAMTTAVVIISVQGEQDYVKEAMAAGARGYLVKPFSADELVSAIRRTHDMELQRRAQLMPNIPRQRKLGRIISIYSAKGGVGKTTIAVNLAAELGKQRDLKVVLADLDLQFGDVAIMLDTSPVRTIADIAREEEVDSETVEACLLKHSTGVNVLASPLRPEQAEIVTGRHVQDILGLLAESYDFVIVDLAQRLDDISLTGLDMADVILLVASTDLPSIKNAKASLEIMESLGYESGKIKLALSRPSRDHALDINEIEKTLKRKVDVQIPNEERVVFPSVNKGAPFVISNPAAKVSIAIKELARIISPPGKEDAADKRSFGKGKSAPQKRTAGVFAWIFSMFLNGW